MRNMEQGEILTEQDREELKNCIAKYHADLQILYMKQAGIIPLDDSHDEGFWLEADICATNHDIEAMEMSLLTGKRVY